jgi:hypothetical protein
MDSLVENIEMAPVKAPRKIEYNEDDNNVSRQLFKDDDDNVSKKPTSEKSIFSRED